jgi:glycosyltransferase involved in cell wall biosynthesis
MAVDSVLHVISDAGPHPYFRTLIEHGTRSPERLTVGCVGRSGALQEDMSALGVASFALGARSRAGFPGAVVKLAAILRRRRPQVVQTHLVDGTLVGLAAARLARTPVAVMTAHHSHELPYQGPRLRLAERVCVGPLSDHIIAPSGSVAETLVGYAHASAAKIEVVHHGFDMTRLDPSRVDGARVRGELGLENALVFGAVGRLYWLKNQSALVEAFPAVVAAAPDAQLVIVGGGDAAPLVALASRLGISENVSVLSVRNDVPELLAAFDVFVHPAIAESFGMVIVEAMAMERPVVSTRVGIAPDVIESGVNGLLSAGSDRAMLERAMLEMLEIRPRWLDMGTAARGSVVGWTAERMAARYEELYEAWLVTG